MNATPEGHGDGPAFDEITDDVSVVRLEDIPVLAIFAFLVGIVALQFLTRYALNDSLSWTEEVARYCLIAVTFLGSAICARRGTHLALGLAYRYVPTPAVRPLAMVSEAVVAAFFAWLAYVGVEMVDRTSAQMMISVPMSKSVLYMIVTASCALAALYSAFNVVRLSRQDPARIAAARLAGG